MYCNIKAQLYESAFPIMHIVKKILLPVIILLNFQEIRGEDIKCPAQGIKCEANSICKYNCIYSCLKPKIDLPLFGTTVYFSSSSICRAASHDFRTSARNKTVVIQSFVTPNCVFQSSVRNRIASERYSSYNNCLAFQFLSPRISEPILDIVSIHKNFLYGDDENHLQYCSTTSDEPITTETHREGTDRVDSFPRIWNPKESSSNPGFRCVPINYALSVITSVAFRNDASFFPNNSALTVTVNKNENVRLSMTEYEIDDQPESALWRKDDMFLDDVEGTELHLQNVNESSAGFYSFGYEAMPEKRSYIRLIVRTCPKGFYGSYCNDTCLLCLHGGICHDITGECICAPGFNGTMCENACNPGYVGKECNIVCDNEVETPEETCRGLLLCLPDPYGCSCAAGFMGLFCNETCLPKTYGAGCREEYSKYIHPDEATCNSFTGCKCDKGWHGGYCEKSYPVLRNFPFVTVITKHSIEFRFFSWTEHEDYGSGTPIAYRVVYKEYGENSWRYGNTINASEEPQLYLTEIKNLKPGAEYIVGVVVVDSSMNQQEKNITEMAISLPCDSPTYPPTEVFILRAKRKLSVMWNLPPKATWNCQKIESLVKYKQVSNEVETRSQERIVRVRGQSYEIQAEPFTHWKIQICIKAIRQTDRSVMCSREKAVTTLSDSPPAPTDLHLSKNLGTSIVLTWLPPNPPRGELKSYGLLYRDRTTGILYYLKILSEANCENGPRYHCYTMKHLMPDHVYKIELIAFNKGVNEGSVSAVLEVNLQKSFSPLSTVIAVFVPLIIFCGMMALNCYIRMKKSKDSALRVKFLPAKDVIESEFAKCNEALNDIEICEIESLGDEPSNSISLKDLPEYMNNVSFKELKKEFTSVPAGQVYPCSVAKMLENKPKNRYGNILPYDHSRVCLDVSEDNIWGYIHASYMHGYGKLNKYIGTQGPLLTTLSDFWNMVWKEKVSKILMITNLVENGRIKCEKYWPETTCSFNDIEVSLQEVKSYADFIIRTFKISKEKKSREVRQFHFTSWSDHGAPTNVAPFVHFLKKTRDYKADCEAPTVVHCSAGIGRTGTTILLDSMIDMGLEEGSVDVLCHFWGMRKQRMNIVENFDQYLFVHNALVDALCVENTCIPISNFETKYAELQMVIHKAGKTGFQKEFEILCKTRKHSLYTNTLAAFDEENQQKNRSMLILPPDRARPLLPQDTGTTDYINAVYIDSYTQKNACVVTQYPLPETLKDFWRMVYELRSETIVLLQDIDFSNQECPQLCSSDGIQTFDTIHVECQSTTIETNVTTKIFCITFKQPAADKPELLVTLIHLNIWPVQSMLPLDISTLVDVINKVHKSQKESSNSIITSVCSDGVIASGIFCAGLHIVDRIKSDNEIDVFHAAKSVKINRPQFLLNVEQYKCLYDIAVEYLNVTKSLEN